MIYVYEGKMGELKYYGKYTALFKKIKKTF